MSAGRKTAQHSAARPPVSVAAAIRSASPEGRYSMPMDAMATKQNPRSTAVFPQRSALRTVCLLSVNRRADKNDAVSRTGTSNNRITYNPFSSTKVEEPIQVGSLPSSSGVAGVADEPWYTGPNARKIPTAQARAWAVHADTAGTLMDLNSPRW